MHCRKKKPTTFSILAVLLTLAGLFSAGVQPFQQAPPWPLTIEDGSTQLCKLSFAPFVNINMNYAISIEEACSLNILESNSSATQETPETIRDQYTDKYSKISNVGKWGPWSVIDVTNQEIKRKGVLLQAENKQYRILYLQFELSTAPVDYLPIIARIENQEVLIIDVEMPGTGRFHINHNFVLDSSGNPVKIDTSEIDRAIVNAVPQGWGLAKGNLIDIRDPLIVAPVWKTNDPTCCPTGGEIKIVQRLVGSKIVVDSVTY